jgi:hypothetical protein
VSHLKSFSIIKTSRLDFLFIIQDITYRRGATGANFCFVTEILGVQVLKTTSFKNAGKCYIHKMQ